MKTAKFNQFALLLRFIRASAKALVLFMAYQAGKQHLTWFLTE